MPAACTGTSASNAAASSSPGRFRAGCRSIRRPTISPSTPRTTRCRTPAFAGEIPKGEYGGGAVSIWDRGTYVTEKWSDDEVKVVLPGSKVSGRYVLFRTRGNDWMMHRMDPSPAGWSALPELVRPMLATAGAAAACCR